METKTYKSVKFILNDEEKYNLSVSYDIMRQIKNKFLTNKMERKERQMEDAMKILIDILANKEIIE